MSDTVLVTGGAGFIGSHVADHLIEMGCQVVVLDDLSGGFEDNIPHNVEFVHGSILDLELLDRIFSDHKISRVFHLAAYAAEGLSHFIKRFNYQENLVGSVNLVNQCINHGVGRFIFTSSIAVYGSQQIPFSEETTPEPEDPYGIAKYAVELELKSSYEMFGLEHVVFRPHNVYGERQNIGDRYRNVIGIFMNNILQGRPLPVFGDGEQTRAFSYIDDVAPAIAKSGFMEEARNQTYNIGADRSFTINELVRKTSIAFNTDAAVQYLEARNEVLHAASDHTRAKAVFGDLMPNVDLETGIAKMADWVRHVGSRKSKKFDNIEITKGLPDSWTADE